jgi:hypothetical protein
MNRFTSISTLTAQKLITLLMPLTLVVMSYTAVAEAPRWYEVEVALIGYQDKEKINHENWPEILINEQSSDVIDGEQVDLIEQKVEPWSWLNWWNSTEVKESNLYNVQRPQASDLKPAFLLKTPFSETGTAFEDKVAKFKKQKGLQLIWSKKWQQPIPEKEGATQAENAVKINFRIPLNFQQSLKSSAPLLEAEVTGEIHLYRSRYLHLVSALNIQHWQSLNSTNRLDKSINILPNHPQKGINIIPSRSSTPLTAISEIPLRAAHVNQSRRMRSNELHYIDHPLLGILVRVTPLADVSE